jgi:hypothetical protein
MRNKMTRNEVTQAVRTAEMFLAELKEMLRGMGCDCSHVDANQRHPAQNKLRAARMHLQEILNRSGE